MANSTPQNAYLNQSLVVNFDINDYYSRVIQSIDSFRSRFDSTSSNIRQAITAGNIDKVFVDNQVNSLTAQESRCNTFFRMMGFPVSNADGSQYYSPGFNPEANRDDEQVKTKLLIADSMLDKFQFILNRREFYPKERLSIFAGKNENSIALAIASIYVRPFDKQLKDGLGPLDIDQQNFVVSMRGLSVTLEFADDDALTYPTQSTHILKPFLVDPRAELTVTPAANRICAPFLSNKSMTQLSKGVYLKRPYLEKVIRDRINAENPLDPSSADQTAYVSSFAAFIKASPVTATTPLIESSTTLTKTEQAMLGKYISILQALTRDLAKCYISIEKTRSSMNWKPIPDPRGPEFGCTLNAVNLSDLTNNKLIEINIGNKEMQKFISDTDFGIGLDAPDEGNFIFSDVDDVIFGSPNGAAGTTDSSDKQLKTLTNRRNEQGNQAINLLRYIEIITGEFSGLGILDIIAIQATFWAMDMKFLLGLIDSAAFMRMQQVAELKTAIVPEPSIINSLMEFEKRFSAIYALIDSFYQGAFNAPMKNK